jgi:hypothetical protein
VIPGEGVEGSPHLSRARLDERPVPLPVGLTIANAGSASNPGKSSNGCFRDTPPPRSDGSMRSTSA